MEYYPIMWWFFQKPWHKHPESTTTSINWVVPPVTVANEGLAWDPLLKIWQNPELASWERVFLPGSFDDLPRFSPLPLPPNAAAWVIAPLCRVSCCLWHSTEPFGTCEPKRSNEKENDDASNWETSGESDQSLFEWFFVSEDLPPTQGTVCIKKCNDDLSQNVCFLVFVFQVILDFYHGIHRH